MAIIDLTTSARVKAALSIDASDTSQDTWIDAAITSVSQRIEMFIDREVETATRTEEYDVSDGRQETIFLRTYPVTSITSIKNDPSWDFAAATALDSELYRLDGDNGEVHFRTELAAGPKAVQIVYVGGLAADTAAFIAAYPAITGAADIQIAAMFRRRSSPQGETIIAGRGAGQLKHEAPLKLIPEVRETLIPFRRLRFGV